MIFYELSTKIGILTIYVLFIISAYLFLVKKQHTSGLFLLLLGSFAIRLFMAFIDPYLNDWDERFHALVAKNMMQTPLQPMLHQQPVMNYNYQDWCCNHIWLHKQPLFLWQMALSMHLFGVNEVAIRIPSVLLGTLSVLLLYQVVTYWLNDKKTAFIAALLSAVFYYHLELISGRYGMEHNDLSFGFYLLASIWAWTRYQSTQQWGWAATVGVFAGAAILNKWLTGLLIYGGWGWFILIHPHVLKQSKTYVDYGLALLSTIVIALPWQLYIIYQFPKESAWEYRLNSRHISEVIEQHTGSWDFYFYKIYEHFGIYLCSFLILGIFYQILRLKQHKKESIFLVMGLIFFSFFSFIAQTKVSGFLFPIYPLFLGWIALGIHTTIKALHQLAFAEKIPISYHLWIQTIFWGVHLLSFNNIGSYRSIKNVYRNAKIANTQTFKTLTLPTTDRQLVIFNLKPQQHTELMFYQHCSAYAWFPKEAVFDTLVENTNYQLIFFSNHGNQYLPSYIYEHPNVLVLDDKIQ